MLLGTGQLYLSILDSMLDVYMILDEFPYWMVSQIMQSLEPFASM